MGKISQITELKNIRRESFVVNRFATNDTSCTQRQFWRKCFVIEWSSIKSTKLFCFRTFYVYGTVIVYAYGQLLLLNGCSLQINMNKNTTYQNEQELYFLNTELICASKFRTFRKIVIISTQLVLLFQNYSHFLQHSIKLLFPSITGIQYFIYATHPVYRLYI